LLLALPFFLPGTISTAHADSLLPQGAQAPPLTLQTLDGKAFTLSDHSGKIVVLLFGELYNQNSLDAAKVVADVLAMPAMADTGASGYLIVAQDATPDKLRAEAEKKNVKLPILRDPGRLAFATYKVMVLPSLVIVAKDGTISLASSGYPLDFKDILTDSLLFASGLLSQKEFDRRRNATNEELPPEQLKALRQASLGDQLILRGADQLAKSSYEKALEAYADCVQAHVGLGKLLLRQGHLAEAEQHFSRALKIRPDSVDAALGMVNIQAMRGGDELKTAKKRVTALLEKLPNDARVLYHAALVAEKSGDTDSALGYYKKAATILLYGQQEHRGQ